MLLMGIPSNFLATANIAPVVTAYEATAIPANGNMDIPAKDEDPTTTAVAAAVAAVAMDRFLVEFVGWEEEPDIIVFGFTP